MLKLLIGNKAYSSWSMRGWLAVKQSGLPFEEVVLPMYDEAWPARRTQPDLAPSNGKIPLLWDGDVAVWESLAIVDWLADKAGRDLFWPAADDARAFARSIASEMHAGYQALRKACSMNVRRVDPPAALGSDVQADVDRIAALWTQARQRFGEAGPYLFGTFGAADIMFAPVATRFVTYAIDLPPVAATYRDALLAQPFVADWIAAAQDEPWTIAQYERADPSGHQG